METARGATEADLDRVAELAVAAAAELAEQRGGALFLQREASAGVADLLRSALARPAAHVAVGLLDDHVVGFALVEVDDLARGGRLGVVRQLYVEPDARAVGVGEALVNEVLAFCSAQGCTGVDAYALPGSRAAKNFFEEQGLTARLLVMHRRLDGS